LDATLWFLNQLIDDCRDLTPPQEYLMQERGWKEVKPGLAPQIERQATDAMAIDEPDIEDDSDMKMVFHPPRGSTGRPTKCHNLLFKCTNDSLRKPGPNPDNSMDFRFKSTLAWYQEQFAEGRGYEHISLWTFKEFSNRYGIPP
jgi:chromo domain-containing protein 1